MYVIGFVDDDREAYLDYKERLKRKGIELLYPDDCSQMKDIVDWILSKCIKCVLVDYKIRKKFDFLGTELVAFINSELPDLPCIILTNYPEESIGEKLVVSSLIEDRNVLDADDIEGFVQKLQQAVEVYDNRLEKHVVDYTELLELKKSNKINSNQEERLDDLYRLLRAYGEVDDLPSELLNTEVNKKLDEILGRVTKLIDNTEKR